MDYKLLKTNHFSDHNITISGSKSESNRLLILKQLYGNLEIENLSSSDDTRVLQEVLNNATKLNVADVHHAGTSMRFLTAYFALVSNKSIILTGSERMQKRPIKILVEALQILGAKIKYLKQEGYPPVEIQKNTEITQNKVAIQGNVSSQYISALMLVAPKLKNGLEIELIGKVTSVPYIEMTLSLLQKIGVKAVFSKNKIKIAYKERIEAKKIAVESDWSSASYWYSFVALSKIGTKIMLSSYQKNSLQGDNCLVDIYKHFGVKTTFFKNAILLEKVTHHTEKELTEDLKNAPDIAQTVVVTCFGLGISCNLSGLHTLKIKETDRLIALKNELQKLGAVISITNDSLRLEAMLLKINENISIKTYNDHRMAMAFAPLVLKVPITILNAEVVSKSYPNFWSDFHKVGVQIMKV